jgi:hypothetical protein
MFARPGTATGDLVPGGEDAARERLDAYLNARQRPTTVAQDPQNDETPVNTGVLKYRYRDSNPGFRRERVLEAVPDVPRNLSLAG